MMHLVLSIYGLSEAGSGHLDVFFFFCRQFLNRWFPAKASGAAAVFWGNWVQKWRLAFRSDSLGAICSVFAEGGVADELRT